MYPPRRRKKRAIGATAIALVGIVLLPVLAVLGAVLLIDPNDYKLKIAEAVKRQTGDDLAINGRITILPSLWPTIVADGLTLSKPIVGDYGEIASVSRVEAEIALLPLLSRRLVISRLVLVQPNLRLQAGPTGTPVVLGAPAPTDAKTTAPPAAAAAPRVEIRSVEIRDGEIRWFDGISQFPTVVTLSRLDATAPSADAPMTAHTDFTIAGLVATADVTIGSLARLLDRAATSDWPVRVDAHTNTATLGAEGSLTQPSRGRGYDVRLDGTAADLSALGAIIGRSLPPLRDVAVSAHVSDRAAGAPVWSALSLRAGRSTLVPGLDFDSIQLSAAGVSEPISVALQGRARGADFAASGTFADPLTLARLNQTDAAAPIDLKLAYAGIAATAKGAIGSLARLSGVDVALDLRVPDLASASAPAGMKLPSLTDLRVAARLTEAEGSLRDGVALHDLTLTTPRADVRGEATIRYWPRPSVTLALSSPAIDVDGVLADLGPVQGGDRPEPTKPPKTPPLLPETVAAPADSDEKRVIPNRSLPLAFLRAGDADIDLKAKSVMAGGAPYRDVAAHLVLRDSRLTLDPLAADTPGGRIDGTLTADAATDAMPVAIALHGHTLALKPFLAALGQPDAVSGTALVDVDLRGSGDTPHDLATSADGHVGVSVSDGEIDNRLLTSLAADLLRSPKLAESFGGAPIGGTGAGRTRLRCVALRLDVARGTAAATTLLLDSSRLLLQGSGTVALGDEALALRLRPLLRLGGAGSGQGVVVPMRVGGFLGAPRISLDAAGALSSPGSAAAEHGSDPCPAALAAVAAPGLAVAVAAPASPPPAAGKPPNAAQLLRSLLH